MDVGDYRAGDRDGLVELVREVVALGGAVGWLTVPEPTEVDAWLEALPAQLLVVRDGDTVLACGALARRPGVVMRVQGEVTKVMTHPRYRGRGAGRAVLEALILRAREQDLELLTLECRGNNHGAQRLYATLGFSVTGRRPDAIALGDERFDQVLMHLDLRNGTEGLIRHGSRREGLGSA